MPKKSKEKLLIGRQEKIDFPSMGLIDIDAKIDTGAYTSSIHCHTIYLSKIGSKIYLFFNLLDPKHPKFKKRLFQFETFKNKNIKNSFGDTERRYVIDVPIVIAGKKITTEFSLTDRSKMKYPILLGRKLLQNQFIVDVSRQNIGQSINMKARTSKKTKGEI